MSSARSRRDRRSSRLRSEPAIASIIWLYPERPTRGPARLHPWFVQCPDNSVGVHRDSQRMHVDLVWFVDMEVRTRLGIVIFPLPSSKASTLGFVQDVTLDSSDGSDPTRNVNVAVSHSFVAESTGSKQQAVRSGVFLATARPQPPPEKKTHRNWYRNRRAGPARRVVCLFCRLLFWAVLPFVQTLCAARSAYTREFAMCHKTLVLTN